MDLSEHFKNLMVLMEPCLGFALHDNSEKIVWKHTKGCLVVHLSFMYTPIQ